MPDIAMHHVFGTEVRDGLPENVRRSLVDDPYVFAFFGPDPWFLYKPGKSREGRGRRMHTTKTGAFLTALAKGAREGQAREDMFSYLAGFLCHYALDSTTHPYIIWQTTETWPTCRAHREMEHALDIRLAQREGHWGERHPLTDYHQPRIQLPERMAMDLNRVYREVYGWEGVWKDLNRCYLRYRMVFRLMESPRSVFRMLASVCPTQRFRSLSHVRCAFTDGRDVENLSHTPWHAAFDRKITSTESFPELFEKAKREAIRMITDAWKYVYEGSLTEAELRESVGNRSYLSGLDVEDPRNLTVPSLMPPSDPGEVAAGSGETIGKQD
ncbi:MAG: zinc dependent phospholipase C family protein [Clostridia bacterium]|nr:zinc dependent phospholipase C family protein [Clostridia bacterium]